GEPVNLAVRDSTTGTGIAKAAEAAETGRAPEWEPRPFPQSWWQTRQSREVLVERLLGLFTDPAAGRTRDKTRRRGLAKLLDWLQRQARMLSEARVAIDPDGFRSLEVRARAIGWARSDALSKLTWMVICKGGLVSDITVGDCIELTAALQEHHFRGSAGRPLFYALLKDTGVLPAGAPARLRALRIEGRRSVEQIVGKSGIEGRPVRDLLGEYFTERAPELDHTSLRHIADTIGRLFWRDLEIHNPGIGSLRLEPAVAQAWKERLAHIRDAGGQPVRPR